MIKKFNNIPIFIPELACPHQCVFCDQTKITDIKNIPKPEDISEIVNEYLKTIPEDRHINIAFFGGSFTGIPYDLQEAYLKEAHQYVVYGKVKGIRLSTRPDYIDEKILDLLKRYCVKTIELGAQSTNDEVLRKSGRGHTKKDIEKASEMIIKHGFNLGLQMMIGLPCDTHERAVQTAKDIINMGAENTRIYPTLVIKGTALEKLYREKKYIPLSIEEAVLISKDVYKLFEEHGVKIIRTGLHPSEELTNEKSLIAGPFHPSFKELVLTEIWNDMIQKEITGIKDKHLNIELHPSQINYAAGYKGKNKNFILQNNRSVRFINNNSFEKYDIKITYN